MHPRGPAVNGKAQSRPASVERFISGTRLINAKEPLEHLRLRFARNTLACIADLDFKMLQTVSQADAHAAISWRVLDSIMKEIENHSPNQRLIAAEGYFFLR